MTARRSLSAILTPHQRGVLLDLRRRARAMGGEISAKDFGCAGAVAHLIRKGAVMVTRTERGPRGGEYPYIALTETGEKYASYVVANGLKTW